MFVLSCGFCKFQDAALRSDQFELQKCVCGGGGVLAAGRSCSQTISPAAIRASSVVRVSGLDR